MRPSATGLTLVALVAAGAVLRLWHLGTSHLGYDESFTAMAGRRPFGNLVAFLTAHDSHPPLDYLIHAPIARAGLSEFWFRLPSAVCSIGALALLAWWLRDRPRVAIVATAVMAVAPFQLMHGRQARMYAELELIGVAIAFLSARWSARPRRAHAVAVGALVALGLLTHVSMFLVGIGLLALAGLRRDRAAWEWRLALGAAVGVWALAWAPEFLVQARGGHSGWIPPTSPATLVAALGNAVSAPLAGLVVTATVAGIALLIRTRDPLARVVVCLYAVPVAVGALAGLAFPVTLDRTFTLVAWVPALAIGVLVDAVAARRPVVVAALATAVVATVAVGVPAVIDGHTGPDTPLRLLAAHARAGDIVAVRPVSKAPELQWSLGVRAHPDSDPVGLPGRRRSFALRLGDARLTGRVWLLDWHRYGRPRSWGIGSCHRAMSWRTTSIRCIDIPHAVEAALGSPTAGRTGAAAGVSGRTRG